MADEQQEPGREREPAGWEQRLARRLAEPSQLDDVPEADPTPCLNCGTEVRFAFCPKCGQRRGDYRRSLFGFVRELVAETLEVDGRVARTLRLLLFRPGALTRELNEGRRQRYVSPLRLYLFASLLLFGMLSLVAKFELSVDTDATAQTFGAGKDVGRAAARDSKDASSTASVLRFERSGLEGTWGGDIAKRRLDRLQAMSDDEAVAELVGAFFEHLPVVMFLLLPVFALYLTALMLGRGRYYVEHLVFSLHVHTMWSLLVFAAVLGGLFSDWFMLLLLLIPGYTVFALQHAYDASWGATLVRSFVLWTVYGVTLFIALAMAFAVGALFG